MNKSIFMFSVIMLSILFMPANALGENNCTIGENVENSNWSVYPTSLSLNASFNSTTVFTISSILLGNCNLQNLAISGCTWCTYDLNTTFQMRGTNKPINTVISVPLLPESSTNKTYDMTITLSGTTNITVNVFDNATNLTIAVPNNTIMQRLVNLFVFVPYNQTNYTATNITLPGENVELLIGNITTLVAGMNREDQLRVALLLDTLFKGYNWSFIIKQPELRTIEIPVITQIPLNAEEFRQWQKNCNPIVRQELENANTECNLKYNQSIQTIVSKDSELQHAIEDKRDCQSELTSAYTNVNISRDNQVKEANMYGDQAVTLAMGFIIFAILVVLGAVYRTKYNIKLPFKLPFFKEEYNVPHIEAQNIPIKRDDKKGKKYKYGGDTNMFGVGLPPSDSKRKEE